MNSTHRVEIVPIRLLPHPNADTLSIVQVFDGYTVCVRTEEWIGREVGAYIPPDSVCPATGQFAFLGVHRRIKVKRLRGVISMGLLMPAPEGSVLGEDVAGSMGITHYEPPLQVDMGGEAEKPPLGYRPVYDVESLRRYASVFVPGEPVLVTEKIHGANGRFAFVGGRFYCGSRTEWKRESESSLWWRALAQYSELSEFLRVREDITVYAEVYGQVQDLRYGTEKGEVRLAVFDLLCGNRWIAGREARQEAPALPWVPTVADGIAFDLESILAFAEGESLVPGAHHVREGVVVKPILETTHPVVGRVCLKVVGNGYLERAG